MAIHEEVIKSIEDGLEGIKTDLDKRIDRKFDALAQEMSAQENAFLLGDGRGNRGSNLLAKIASDAGVKSLIAGTSKSAIVKLDGSIFDRKSLVVGDLAGTSEDGIAVPPNFLPELGNMQRRRLGLFDYLPRWAVTSNSVEFSRLTGYVNAAAVQASEGALKAEASMPTDPITASIATIAHYLPLSEQVLADLPALQAQVRDLLIYGVMAKAEAEIIAGSGKIKGLTYASNYTAYTGAASDDTLADAVAKAAEQLDIAGWNAGVAIVHPTDWRIARTQREGTAGDGAYLAGSWRDPAPPTVWGIPVVTSTAVNAGEFIVLDPAQVRVLDRMGATVEFGRVNDQFARNVLTARAEARLGLAVLSPSAVVAGDFEA